jgi:hypothetical protein
MWSARTFSLLFEFYIDRMRLGHLRGAVWAGNILFVSGWLDPDLKTDTDMQSQTVGVFKDRQKPDMADIEPDMPNSSGTCRTSPHTPHGKWFCPLLGGVL